MSLCLAEQNAAYDLANDSADEPRSLREMRAAIAALFFESPEQLDIRHLWTQGGLSYFRVNWWSTPAMDVRRIVRSSFVRVEALNAGWRVRDLTERSAA